MAEQRITTKPTVDALLENDFIFIDHEGALRRVRKSDADIASAAALAAESTARQEFEASEIAAREAFEENIVEANEEFAESVDTRMDTAESAVYGAYPTGAASGSIASFTDGADGVPMKSLKVAIVPKQAGSGDPSPDNVRPITGWTDADVNVARTHTLSNSFNDTSNGAEINKYLDSNGNLVNQVGYAVTEYIPVEEGDDCSITNSNVNAPSMCFYDKNKTFLIGKKYNNRLVPTETAPANAKFVRFSYGPSWNSIVTVHTTTTPVPLGQTVYGGTVDVTTGVLTIDSALFVMTGDETGWANAGATSLYNTSVLSGALAPSGTNRNISGICSHVATSADGYVGTYVRKAENTYGLQIYATDAYWGITGTDLASKLNYFRTQYQNGTPLQVWYELATQTTVQLTPAQVASLLGTNNVWSDAGAVEVEYRADPTLAYAELQALILENL